MDAKMELLVITGLSGAGKSQAVRVIEDMGYYCIDNIPPALIGRFFEVCAQTDGKLRKVAVVADARSGDFFYKLLEEVESIKATGVDVKILFLDCADEVLVRRYKETRRRHPLLDVAGSLEKAVAADRLILKPVKEQANYVIDTTLLSITQLKQRIIDIFADSASSFFQIDTLSFGFKYGIPVEADLVFDVRFLPNPYYVQELRPRTGLDDGVRDYVFSGGAAGEFLEKLQDLVGFLLPKYVEEGKTALVVAVGCTGGHHRSVAIAHALAAYIRGRGYPVTESHRDLGRT